MNGVFLCKECSLDHRKFGLKVSQIKSISDGELSKDDVSLLSYGGNRRFIEYIGNYGMKNEPSEVKYFSKAAEFYRTRVSNLFSELCSWQHLQGRAT